MTDPTYSKGDLPEDDTGDEEINVQGLMERLGVCQDMVCSLLESKKSRELALVRTKVEEAILWLREVS